MISVIVPIYNVEDYLERCINSILGQTFIDFELILVDDGSPDNCGQICDEYENRDSRIKVVHKENGGLSDARNAGMKIAKGEFVVFIDSDDWIATDFLEKLMYVQKDTGSDIVECGIIRTSDYMMNEHNNEALQYAEFNTEDALKELIMDGIFHQYVWNKLYKREVIGQISFEKGKTNEDEFWTYQVFGKAKKVVKLDSSLYYYFQRSSSIMGTGYSLKRLDGIEAKILRQRYIEERYPDLADTAKQNLFYSCIYAGQMSMKYLNNEAKQKSLHYMDAVIKEHFDIQQYQFIKRKKDRIWFVLGNLSLGITCIIRNILKIGL